MPGWLSSQKAAWVLCLHESLIARINASDRLGVITGGPATTSPTSSDNEDSLVWKECHELNA